MIPFDITKIEVKHVRLKSCTTALGGSISILDETRSTPDEEVFTKLRAPFSVVRGFIKRHKVRSYLNPVLCAATFYNGHVVALERHQLAGLADEDFEDMMSDDDWFSSSEKNVDHVLMPLTSKGDWFTDGTFVYRIRENVKPDRMTSDGRFLAVPAYAIKFADLHDSTNCVPDYRTCLRYVSSTGQSATTSPIWKSLDTVGNRQLDHAEAHQDDEALMSSGNCQFDRIDQSLAVNLSFGLKAGRELSELFGFDAIEPLQLDDLMIQLKTVNLPAVAKSVKETFDIGVPFTHAVAWMIGLTQRVHTLESYMVLRSLLKYLTTKGFYRKNAFTPNAVYKEGLGMNDVPLKTVEEAAEFDGIDDGTHRISELRRSSQRNGATNGTAGTLYGAE